MNKKEGEIKMANLTTPFRYDYVGSFLRPEKLKKARADFEAGKITREQLKEVEDACILELVAKIKELGYHVITDGEFRRATWHLDFMWGVNGVGHAPTQTGLPFHGEAAMIDDTYLTGKGCSIRTRLWSTSSSSRCWRMKTALRSSRSRHRPSSSSR